MRLVRQLPDRHLLSANGAAFIEAWGNRPRDYARRQASADGSRVSLLTTATSTGSGATARFSVSPSQLDALLGYVETQEEHHRSRTFRRYTASSCANTASSRTNVMCGIEATPPVSRAFSARSEAVNIPGRLPQAGDEAVPLALNR
jgi:hypothetical protein